MSVDDSQPDGSGPPLRIGFICVDPLDRPGPLSGMPHHMAKAMRERGIEIVELRLWAPLPGREPLPARVINRLRWEWRRHRPPHWQRLIDDAYPAQTRRRMLRNARRRTARIQRHLDAPRPPGQGLDAIFVCCAHNLLLGLVTDLPIIFYSDATSYLLRRTYTRAPCHGDAYFDAVHHIEHQTLPRASTAVYASPSARDSAVNELGIDPARTHVVPMGAHIVPQHPNRITAPAVPPTRDDCTLLIVAADPVRKRVDLALDATLLLRKRGINATLHVVGPGTGRSNASPAAVSHGFLKLSDPHDRQIHRQLLQDAHLQILPSTGEAFGIAPAESAHFARPSIVSDAGGLPFVVLDQQTGIVIDRHAGAGAWADAVESLIDHPETYRRMSTAALDRARAELNWDAWGRSMHRIIEETIAEHRRVPPAC